MIDDSGPRYGRDGMVASVGTRECFSRHSVLRRRDRLTQDNVSGLRASRQTGIVWRNTKGGETGRCVHFSLAHHQLPLPGERNLGRVRLTPRRLVLVGTVDVQTLLYCDRFPPAAQPALAAHSVVTPVAGYNFSVGAARLGLSAANGGGGGSDHVGTIVWQALERLERPVLLGVWGDGDTGFNP